MLRQLEALRLVVGAYPRAVELVGHGQHLLVHQPADDLAVVRRFLTTSSIMSADVYP